MWRHILWCASGICPVALFAQEPPPWGRAERVVLYSPHFDRIPAAYGGLSCPAQPLRLYGFEGRRGSGPPALRVRLETPKDFGFDESLPIAGAEIRLTQRWEGRRFAELPDAPPWRGVTNAEGVLTLQVPVGVYEVRIDAGAPLGRGIIQVRAGGTDSLRALVRPPAAC